MNTLKSLNDIQLVQSTRALVTEERRITLAVLRHLAEIEARGLHLKEGYDSLHEFCVTELGYSDGGAGRRIAAMSLIRGGGVEAERAIASGALSLSVAAKAQGLRKRQKSMGKPVTPAPELIGALLGKSERKAEEILVRMEPELFRVKPEGVRTVAGPGGESATELRVVLTRVQFEKLQKLRALWSQRTDGPGWAELLEKLADFALQKTDPERSVKPVAPRAQGVPSARGHAALTAQTRRVVWQRDGGRCSYVTPTSGRRCDSRWRLEIDHRQPRALGGSDAPANLRLLCSAHHGAATRAVFG